MARQHLKSPRSLSNRSSTLQYMLCLIYHHQIGSMNYMYYPLFRARSWNNGMRCMSLYILILKMSTERKYFCVCPTYKSLDHVQESHNKELYVVRSLQVNIVNKHTSRAAEWRHHSLENRAIFNRNVYMVCIFLFHYGTIICISPFYPYPSGLLDQHWGNYAMQWNDPEEYGWISWVNQQSPDNIAITKHSTTKPRAYFMECSVYRWLCTKLWYLQCIGTGDTIVLY